MQKSKRAEEQKLKKTALRQTLLLMHCFAVVLLLLCVLVVPSYASQGGEILPSGNPVRNALAGHDTPMAMAKDSVGNIIVTGFNGASGSENFYTVKFKADGSGIMWAVPYNGPSSNKDKGLAIAVDSNDDVIVTGSERNATNTNYDIYTVKYLAASGTIASGWPKVYNGGANGDDFPVAVVVDQNSSDKVYVGGYTATANRDDFVIISYNSNGTMNTTWGGTGVVTYDNPTTHGDDRISSIAVLSTGGSPGLAVTGFTWNGTYFDGLTVKFNLNGTVKWPYQLSDITGDNRESIVRMDTAGNVIVAGYIFNGSNKNIHVMRLDKDTGSKTVGGWEQVQVGGYQDEVPGGLFVDSNYVYMTGSVYSGTTSYDLYIAKYALSDGELLESAKYTTAGGNDEIPTGIEVNASGEVFVTGNTINASTHFKDWLTAKYSASLDLLWDKTFDGIAGKNDSSVGLALFLDTIPDPDREYVYVAGSSDTNASVSDVDYYMIKYDAGTLNRPTNLIADAVDSTTIDLEWTDNSSGENGFKIERCTGLGCSSFAYLATDTSSPYQDSVSPGNIYRYRVYAYTTSPAENSYYSNEAQANTTALNPTSSTWIYTYDGSGNDEATSISTGPDQHPVVTGSSGVGVEPNDYYTIKMNRTNASVTTWKGGWDDPDNGEDDAFAVVVDSNNDVIVTGKGQGSAANGNPDIYTIKYLSSGVGENASELWAGAERYSGDNGINAEDTAVAAAVDVYDNVFVVGYGENDKSGRVDDDIYIIKYPNCSEPADPCPREWAAIYDGTFGDDRVSGVVVDAYGNPYITGYSHNGTNTTFFTAKYCGATGLPGCNTVEHGNKNEGEMIWSKTFNGEGTGDNYATAIDIGPSGNVYVTGSSTTPYSNKRGFYTIKYNGLTGAVEWEKSYQDVTGTYNYDAVAVKVDPIDQQKDDGIIVLGTVRNGEPNSDFYIIRYDENGGVGPSNPGTWQRSILKPTTQDTAVAMAIDSSGNVCVAGNSGTEMLAVKLSYADGEIIPYGIYQGTKYDAGDPNLTAAAASNDYGEMFIAGSTKNASANFDIVVFKCLGDTISVPTPFTLTPVAGNGATNQQINLSWSTATLPPTPTPTFTLKRKDVTCSSPGTVATTASSPTVVGTGTMFTKYSAGSIITINEVPYTISSIANNTQLTLTTNYPATASGLTYAGSCAWIPVTLTPNTVTTKSDTNLLADNNYCYSLVAHSGAIDSRELIKCKLTVKEPPVLVNPITIVSQSQLTISWNNTVGNLGYKLERGNSSCSGGWTQVGGNLPPVDGGLTETGYTDTGLSAGTTYCYRVSVLNLGGYSLPCITPRTGRTDPIVPTLNNIAAADVYYNSVTVTWADVIGESGYRVQVCSTGTYGATSAADCTNAPGNPNWTYVSGDPVADATSKNVTGLSPGTLYYFRLFSKNGTREIGPSAVKSAKTRLNTPSIQNQAGSSTSQIYLEWTNPNPGTTPPGPDETSYTVEYARCVGTDPEDYRCTNLTTTSTSYWDSWQSITGLTGQSTTIGSLTTGRTYRLRVTAVCASPCSDTGTNSVESTIVAATVNLVAPTGVTATPVSDSQIDLAWNDTVGETNYQVYKDGAPDDVKPKNTPRTHSETGLNANTTYCFTIRAYNTQGGDATSSPAVCAKTFTLPPDLISVIAISSTQIAMTWSNETGETGYEVEESHLVDQNDTNKTSPASGWTGWTLIATKGVDVITHTHTVCPGDTYRYRVRTLSAPDPPSGYSTIKQATTTAPNAPTSLTLAVVSQTRIDLTWNSSTAPEYALQRCSTGSYGSTSSTNCTNAVNRNGNWSTIYTGTTLNYQDTTLTEGTIYYYRIRGKEGCGYSTLSSSPIQIGVTVPKTPDTLTATATSTDTIRTDWALTSNEQGYFILSKKLTAANCSVETIEESDPQTTKTQVTPGTTVTWNFAGLLPGSTYCFRICSYNNTNMQSPYSGPVSKMTTLPAPTSLTATAESETQIRLSWDPITGNAGYLIERSLDNFATAPSFTDTAPQDAVSYVDNNGLSAGTKYYYRIAVNNGEVGIYSLYTFNSTLNDSGTGGMNLSGSSPTYQESGLRLYTTTSYTSATNNILNTDNHIIEFDIKFTSANDGNWRKIFGYNAGGSDRSPGIWMRTDSVRLHWRYDPGNTGVNALGINGDGGTAFAVNTNWYHIKGVKSGSNFKVYVDSNPLPVVDMTVANPKTAGTAPFWFGGANVILKNFRIESGSGGAYSAYSAIASVTTRSAAPTSLTLNLLSQSSGTVSWQEVEVSFQVSKGATHYKVERYLLANPIWAPIGSDVAIGYGQSYCGLYPTPSTNCPTLINNYTTIIDNSGVLEDSEYCYQVKAWNADGGYSVPSTMKCITTLSSNAPTLICPDIANGSCPALKSRQVDLVWSPAKCGLVVGNCDKPHGFEVESKEGLGHWINKAVIANPNATTFADAIGIQPGTDYVYRVRSYRLDIDDNFASGINAAIWTQGTSVPDGYGSASVTAIDGAVRFITTTTGSGTGTNSGKITLVNPDILAGDFDLQLDYSLPNGQETANSDKIYARMVLWFQPKTGSMLYVMVERDISNPSGSYQNNYRGYAILDSVITSDGYLPTSDTSGKMRITRNGTTVSMYALIQGHWYLLNSVSDPALSGTPVNLIITQRAAQGEVKTLTAYIDNFKLNNKSAFSNQRAITTPVWSGSDEACH